jgi:spermidine synthase
VVLDDGRAFMERTHGTYDLIVLAATDSLALTSSFANLPTQSYLFTREAFESAKRHLSPNGVLAMYNYYRRPWIVHKLAGMLAQVFGYAPYVRVFSARTQAAC